MDAENKKTGVESRASGNPGAEQKGVRGSFPTGWKLAGGVVLGLAVLQLADPALTYAVLALGLVLRQVNFLARLQPFLQEMGTFYTPLAIAVGLMLLTPRSWRQWAKYEQGAKLLLVVALSAGVCELLKIGFGKERMKELVAARMALAPTSRAAAMASQSGMGDPEPGGASADTRSAANRVSSSGFSEVDRQIIRDIRDRGVPAVRFVPLHQWLGPKGTKGFTSMPSSHTLAAFACFLMLARFVPALTPLCWVLAVGCGLSRIWAMDHYFSDVLAGALLAYGMIRLLEKPLKLKS